MPKEITAWTSWAEYRRDEQLTADLPSGGDIPCALFFPADYAVGMANLGYHYVYRKLRELGVAVERFFNAPSPFRSVERDTMLERFPVVLAGISYEGDIPVWARWLKKGGIPPERKSRTHHGAPLIGVGGAMTYINPLALSAIADFIVLGDALAIMPFVAETLRGKADRDTTLKKLAEHPSIMVPSCHLNSSAHRFELHTSKTDIEDDYGVSTWITPRTVFGRTLLMELQRGCVGGCRYCTLPASFRPFRQRKFDALKELFDAAAKRCDFEQIGFVTPEASDYPELDNLLELAARNEKKISFASLRVDGLRPNRIAALTAGGRKSITIAPESGDDELRAACGKKFTNEDILRALAMAKENGVTGVKLYFMIGLPGETDRHIEEIARLSGRIKKEVALKITSSISPFVPKPGTAWAGVPFEGEKRLKKKFAALCARYRQETGDTLHGISVKEACLEYAIAWADMNTASQIAGYAENAQSVREMLNYVNRDAVHAELKRLGIESSK